MALCTVLEWDVNIAFKVHQNQSKLPKLQIVLNVEPEIQILNGL